MSKKILTFDKEMAALTTNDGFVVLPWCGNPFKIKSELNKL